MRFRDLDTEDILTVHAEQLEYTTPAKGSEWKSKQYHLMVYKDEDKEKEECCVPWDVPQVMACLEANIEDLNKSVLLLEKDDDDKNE